jgi:hypothetical protein
MQVQPQYGPGGYPPQNIPQQLPQQQMPSVQQPQQQTQSPVIQAGPGVPPELVGKTQAEVFQYYQALRDNYLASLRGAQQIPAPQQPRFGSGYPQNNQQPPTQQQPQQQQPAQEQSFWRNPREFIAGIIDERLAPVTTTLVEQQAQAVRDNVAREFADFNQYLPAMEEALAGAPPQLRANPEVWRTAYYVQRGRALTQGQQQPVAPPAQQNMIPAPGRAPAPQTPGYIHVEPPTAPQSQFTNMPLAPELSPREKLVASKMGMTEERYQQWKNGTIPVAGSNGGGQ